MKNKKQIYKHINDLNMEIARLIEQVGEVEYVFEVKTRGNFLWRLWFLISSPIVWLIKGTIKIK